VHDLPHHSVVVELFDEVKVVLEIILRGGVNQYYLDNYFLFQNLDHIRYFS